MTEKPAPTSYMLYTSGIMAWPAVKDLKKWATTNNQVLRVIYTSDTSPSMGSFIVVSCTADVAEKLTGSRLIWITEVKQEPII